MSNFKWAFNVLMKHEGGFVDHENDPGGATNYGISLRFLKSYGIDVDGDGHVDVKDIQSLTPERAERIYKEKFWNPCRCDEIKSELIATKIFDMAVNMGQIRAYKIVQQSVNLLGYERQLTVDGVVGPSTLKALNDLSKKDYELLEVIREEQASFYLSLISQKPELASFKLGWLRRAMA